MNDCIRLIGILLAIAMLMLVYSCSGDSSGGKNSESSAAEITGLILGMEGTDQSIDIDFSGAYDATLDYLYSGENPPDTVLVKSITISSDATANVAEGAELTITDDEAVITVLAQDGTTKIYTIRFNFAKAGSSEAEIEQLVLTIGDERKTVDWQGSYEASVDYMYVSGEEIRPSSAIVYSIGLSFGAKASVIKGTELDLSPDNRVTITVIAENGTEQIYNLVFNFIEVAGNIDKLSVIIGGESREIDFSRENSIEIRHALSVGTEQPDSFIIEEIVVSSGATASHNDETIDKESVLDIVSVGTEYQSTIRITAENGSTADYTIIFKFVEEGPLESIVVLGSIPERLYAYSDLAQEVLAPYASGATIIARYVTEEIYADGARDGSSWDDATSDLPAVLDAITDASADRVYLVLVAGGNHESYRHITMKNHVAIVGGFDNRGSWIRSDASTTFLWRKWDQGSDFHGRIFDNSYSSLNPLDLTAMLHSVTIKAGSVQSEGGGMLNKYASPSITNVVFADNLAQMGGGMYNEHSSPVLTDVTFQDNRVTTLANGRQPDNSGGGIYNYVSSPELTNVIFNNNEAYDGGGLYNDDGSAPALTSIIFTSNEAEHYGGGMYNAEGSSPVLTSIRFIDNESKSNGGGLYSDASSFLLTYATFENNIAADNGGGIYSSGPSMRISNAAFSGNSADRNGGGIFNTGYAPILTNITFADNSADNNGGGISSLSSSPILINATFANNFARRYGGGMYTNNYGEEPIIVNSIFWGNRASDQQQIALDHYAYDRAEKITIAYSVIKGGTDPSKLAITESYPTSISSSNILTEDPSLSAIADNGGSVKTIAIGSRSSATNIGVHVQHHNDTLYFSDDKTNWYTDVSLDSVASLPQDAVSLTSVDATGKDRSGRPDAGAYEVFSGDINYLRLNINGDEAGVAFNLYGEGVMEHSYFSDTQPDTAIISEIVFADAVPTEGNVRQGDTLLISNNKTTITVTAQDDSTRDYIINFIFIRSDTHITSLRIDVGGEETSVTFDDQGESMVQHEYFSDTTPDMLRIVEIDFVAEVPVERNVGRDATLDISDNKAIITVTTQDDSTRDYIINFIFTKGESQASAPQLSIGLEDGLNPLTDIKVTFFTNPGKEHSGDTASIKDYRVEYSTSGEFVDDIATKTTSQGETTLFSLTPATKYYIRVTATNSVDLTGESAINSHVTYPYESSLTLSGVVAKKKIPDLSAGGYDELSQAVLAPYEQSSDIETIYVVTDGTGTANGSSWNNASSSLNHALDGISDAGAGKMYLILVAGGTYIEARSIVMKNNVAIVGGWENGGGWARTGTTIFSGLLRRVFSNANIDGTALLHSATIEKGVGSANSSDFGDNLQEGGGMYNNKASPTLIKLVFRNNIASRGGGMYNSSSSPVLTDVEFSGHFAGAGITGASENAGGGGMYNYRSSPILTNAVFISNTAYRGGGMHNYNSSPVLTNVVFMDNLVTNCGGGMYSVQSTTQMINATFVNNSAARFGGAICLFVSAPKVFNTTFVNNSARSGGEIFSAGTRNNNDDNAIIIANSIFWSTNVTTEDRRIYVEDMSFPIILAYSVIPANDMSLSDGIIQTVSLNTNDPNLVDLTTDAASLMPIIIGSGSSAINAGVYVRRSGTDFYYSKNAANWYNNISLDNSTVTLPSDAVDPVATDATGHVRTDRPDAGAYERRSN